MIGIYHRSNLLTFLGIVTACAGLSLVLQGLTGHGMLCLVVCGVCDLFDGAFARSFQRDERQKAYGVQLDSLADMLSFGLLPVVLLYAAGVSWFLGLCVTVLYLLAVINRLAFFNLLVSDGDTSLPVAFYRGLPVTYAALALPLIWLAVDRFIPVHMGWALGILLLGLALLYTLDIKIPKPRGMAYLLFGLLALAVAAGILWRL